MEGYINKEGGKTRSWKKRYLVLEKDRLAYYTKNNKKELKGEIQLSDILKVQREGDYKGKAFMFAIDTTSGRNYHIQSENDEDCEKWVAAVTKSLQKPVFNVNALFASSITTTTTTTVTTAITTTTSTTVPSTSTTAVGNTRRRAGVSKTGVPPALVALPTTVKLDDFTKIKVVGRGTFGKVFLVKKNDNGSIYAMKVLKKSVVSSRGEVEHTISERNVLVELAKLNLPFLPKLHYSFQTPDSLYLVMDFINGGELFFHLQRDGFFAEERAKFYAAQLVCCIGAIHKAGIIYRDLKPENVLLSSEGNIILTDFGLSKAGLNTPDARTSTFCGTPDYLAPEIIKGDPYTKAVDWWSVGTLTFEMLAGYPPFYAKDKDNTYFEIMRAPLVIPPELSPEAADLLKKLIERDTTKRIQDLEQIQKHPWFNGIDWKKLEKLEVSPPFVPDVKSADDLSNIDEGFLDQDVNANSDEEQELEEGQKDQFLGFTFVPQEESSVPSDM